MSFRVIDGGRGLADRSADLPIGEPSPIAIARAAVVNRVAGAIYAAHDPSPDYADWGTFCLMAGKDREVARRVHEYLAMARQAITALRPAIPAHDDARVAVEAWVKSTVGGEPGDVVTHVQGWIDEVLGVSAADGEAGQ